MACVCGKNDQHSNREAATCYRNSGLKPLPGSHPKPTTKRGQKRADKRGK